MNSVKNETLIQVGNKFDMYIQGFWIPYLASFLKISHSLR